PGRAGDEARAKRMIRRRGQGQHGGTPVGGLEAEPNPFPPQRPVQQSARGGAIVDLARPAQRVADVVPLGLEGLVPAELVGCPESAIGPVDPGEVVLEMTATSRVSAAARGEAFLSVLPQSLELLVAGAERASTGGGQRFVDQAGQAVVDSARQWG